MSSNPRNAPTHSGPTSEANLDARLGSLFPTATDKDKVSTCDFMHRCLMSHLHTMSVVEIEREEERMCDDVCR